MWETKSQFRPGELTKEMICTLLTQFEEVIQDVDFFSVMSEERNIIEIFSLYTSSMLGF